jgi:hypothetical protein
MPLIFLHETHIHHPKHLDHTNLHHQTIHLHYKDYNYGNNYNDYNYHLNHNHDLIDHLNHNHDLIDHLNHNHGLIDHLNHNHDLINNMENHYIHRIHRDNFRFGKKFYGYNR